MDAAVRALFPPAVAVVVASEGDPAWTAPLFPGEASLVAAAVEKRQREFAAGRWCARRAMRKLGQKAVELLVGEGRAPRWPEGLVGSITHCTGFCAAAVAHEGVVRSLGIDAEPMEPLEARLHDLVSTPSERTRFASLGLGACATKAIFSIKESVYKAYYPLAGSFLDFLDVELEAGPGPGQYRAHPVRDDAPSADGRRELEGRFHAGDRIVVPGCVIAGPRERFEGRSRTA